MTPQERYELWIEFIKTDAFKNMQARLKEEGWSIMFNTSFKYPVTRNKEGVVEVDEFEIYPTKENSTCQTQN